LPFGDSMGTVRSVGLVTNGLEPMFETGIVAHGFFEHSFDMSSRSV
jgi:hypothetical protein